MKRWFLLAIGVVPILIVGAAGYLGFQNARSDAGEPPPPVTVAASRGRVERTVTAPGLLVGTQETMLGADVGGRVAVLRVRPGTRVRAGEVLARLDPAPYESALAMAQVRLDQAKNEFERQRLEADLTVQSREAQVGQAQAQFPLLQAAEVRLQAAAAAEDRAQTEYDKALDRPWEPPEVHESYRLGLEQAAAAHQIAQAEYDSVLNERWAAAQQVAALRTDSERAALQAGFLDESGVDPLLEMAVDQAERDLAATVLRAPFDGVVLDIFVRPGAFAFAGANLILVANPAAVEVRTTVIEEDLSLVNTGQPAEIFFDAQPELIVAGVVDRIVPQRVAGEARPLYYVYIRLEGAAPEAVFTGMTADVSIIVDRVEDALRLPRALVRTRSDQTATVEVWQDGRRLPREVETGLRGDVYTVILRGLVAGDQVIGE